MACLGLCTVPVPTSQLLCTQITQPCLILRKARTYQMPISWRRFLEARKLQWHFQSSNVCVCLCMGKVV